MISKKRHRPNHEFTNTTTSSKSIYEKQSLFVFLFDKHILTSEIRVLSAVDRSLPLDWSDEYVLPVSLLSLRDPLLLIGGRLSLSLDSSPLGPGLTEQFPWLRFLAASVFDSCASTAAGSEVGMLCGTAMSASFLLVWNRPLRKPIGFLPLLLLWVSACLASDLARVMFKASSSNFIQSGGDNTSKRINKKEVKWTGHPQKSVLSTRQRRHRNKNLRSWILCCKFQIWLSSVTISGTNCAQQQKCVLARLCCTHPVSYTHLTLPTRRTV